MPVMVLSAHFLAAVRYRAVGYGIVPHFLLRRLSLDEWNRIRLMGSREARSLVARYVTPQQKGNTDGK